MAGASWHAMGIRHVLVCWLLAAVVPAIAGAGTVPDAGCSQALQALTDEETLLRAASPASAPEARRHEALRRLEPLRLSAAKACLGGLPATPPPSQHLMHPPIVVPSITLPAPALRVPAPTPPTPVARPAPPATVTACDPNGCTASDGSRLQRVGPNLIGPRGLCTLQGVLLSCP